MRVDLRLFRRRYFIKIWFAENRIIRWLPAVLYGVVGPSYVPKRVEEVDDITRNDILQWARDANVPVRNYYDEIGLTFPELKRFAKLAYAAGAERAIRARGEK